ncbi:multi-sensor hybrid histidine kinase [Euzebya pacifica]|uniref:histidine kinase n=1 Tax=Euzebya pacifica TaxID=1608957 RepID=A0A346Y015_9ACTN|nr:ATP-binding protein [Euzebya pacifica]AXV07812.1 multi-sensor hybrid histidine kinase [Euzebya pacifica]
MELNARDLVGAAPVPWCLVDGEGRVVRVNDRMAELCESSPAKLEGREFLDLVDPTDRARILVPRPESTVWMASTRLMTGRPDLHVTVTGAPVPTSDGSRMSILVLSDISELVRATAEVDELRRAALDLADQRIAMVATVAHELRSPLHAINGWTEMLAASALDPEQRDLIVSLETAVGRLRRTVDEFLEISRLDAGEVVLRPTDVDVRSLVGRVMEQHRQRAEDTGTDLQVVIAPAVPAILHIDGYRLDQILTNLVANAVTHGAGESVRVDVDTIDGTLRLAVQDRGPGVPEAYRERIFDAFVRAPGSEAGGTGLGLPLVRSLTRRLGGDVRLEAPSDGGTRFAVTLPLLGAGDPPRTLSPVEGDAVATTAASARVLVVEDNEMIQLLSAQQLRSLGHAPTVVGTGAEALEFLLDATRVVDLVLMDWQLPDLRGTEVCRRFREVERRQKRGRTPVIALTANAMPDTRAACLAAGMDDFLPKPVSAAALGTMVVRWTAGNTDGAGGPPVIDAARLLALGAGGTTVTPIAQAVRHHLTHLEDDLDRLAEDDPPPVRRLLHGHRVSCEVMGLAQLAGTLREMMHGGGHQDDLRSRAREDIQRIRRRINTITEHGPPATADLTAVDREAAER